MHGTVARSHLELGALTGAVPCARLHARAVMQEWGLSALADDVELIVSELMTNAVEVTTEDGQAFHVTLCLKAEKSGVRIEVWDASPKMPHPEPHAIDSDSGRGYEIITMLSTTFGVEHDPYGFGKTIWVLVPYDSV